LVFACGRQALKSQGEVGKDELSIDAVTNRGLTRQDQGRDESGSDIAADIGALFLLKPQTWGRHTLLHWWDIGSLINSGSNLIQAFELGGLFSLSGYARDELSGSHVSMGRLLYYRRMTDDAPPLLNTPIYLGASLVAGNVWQDRSDFSVGNTLAAGSVFAVFDTVIGPLYIAYGAAEGGRRSAYLFPGQTF
jgi:NTE family protein